MSAVVTFDAYIIIKIGGEKVFKSKTIDSNSHSTIGETFVSDAIEVDAIIEIEMWNSNTVDLVSTWKGNAEYFTTRGEQTLSSEKTSLTIRAKYTKGSESVYTTMCFIVLPTFTVLIKKKQHLNLNFRWKWNMRWWRE